MTFCVLRWCRDFSKMQTVVVGTLSYVRNDKCTNLLELVGVAREVMRSTTCGSKHKCVNTLTLSASKWIFWYFHTLGHLNGSNFFNIHHRNLPIVPFNSELNSAHFWLKNSKLHEKLAGSPLGERASKTLFPRKV